MKVVSLSFNAADISCHADYSDYICSQILNLSNKKGLWLVLPAHTSFLLAYGCGVLGTPACFMDAWKSFIGLPEDWHNQFLELQCEIAKKLSIYLVPGTFAVKRGGKAFNSSCLISPEGDIMGLQHQLFLSREERALGLSRGTDAKVIATGQRRLGIIVGTDAFYPETGRVLALKGADLICHCGALPAVENRWRQLAGMWQQVQQNQFFCIESQLCANIAGMEFAAESLIHAPCEMTEGYEGILARGGLDGEPVTTELDFELLHRTAEGYPLMRLLNPAAYRPLCGEAECGEF